MKDTTMTRAERRAERHSSVPKPIRRILICLAVVFSIGLVYGFQSDAIFAASNPYRIVIDISKQRVYVYSNSSGKVVKSMICSTGKSGSPTPRGSYRLGDKYRWYHFSKYKVYAQYTSRFNGPYLMHSVLYRRKDTDTLVQSSVNNLGSRASKGCVRLRVSDAKWIYNNCKRGTSVRVQS